MQQVKLLLGWGECFKLSEQVPTPTNLRQREDDKQGGLSRESYVIMLL